MVKRLTFLQDEKAAGDGCNIGILMLPLCCWYLYTASEPVGELDDAARLCYVIKRIAPTILMQWFCFEVMATYRAATTKAGTCPAPWEAQDRAGVGKPTPTGIDVMNPPFHALWFRGEC